MFKCLKFFEFFITKTNLDKDLLSIRNKNQIENLFLIASSCHYFSSVKIKLIL